MDWRSNAAVPHLEADWEALGAEAVREGMPLYRGMTMRSDSFGVVMVLGDCDAKIVKLSSGWVDRDLLLEHWWPDFREELTAYACVGWVRSVAREVHGLPIGVDFRLEDDEASVWVASLKFTGRTLPQACIRAVRTIRGGEG